MLRLANIYPLSDFRHSTKDFVDRVKATGAPIILTVNGRAEIVVFEATSFQELVDRLNQAEKEIRELKEALARKK